MPFNNNTLDDLFRDKDKELPPDTHRMDAHWDQMQQLLSPSAPLKKTTRNIASAVPIIIGSLAILLTGTILFFTLRGKNKTEAENSVQPLAKNEVVNTVPVSSNESINSKQPEIKATDPVTATSPKKAAGKDIAPAPVVTAATAPAHKREYIVLPQEPQVFHIIAGKDTSVLCKHGTTIKIPANSLADSDGNTVEGEVTMIVQEYYRYEDIIAAGLNRNAEMKKKSITAGMVKFDAYRDEQKLDVKPGRSIEIRMRKDLINIKPGQLSANNAGAETGDANKMQDLNIHNLGWISYERFYNDTRPVTDIRIQIPKNVDVNKLISQLAFISVEGVMPGYIEKNQVVFYNIPIGEKAWFISLGTTGKKFLSCVEQVEVKGNDVVTPTFRETSPEQFKRQLEMLTALPVKER